jgi:hypothetical protein
VLASLLLPNRRPSRIRIGHKWRSFRRIAVCSCQ